ncbi:MAG: lipase family protein [Flavobacteriaceae bacterium]|nr:lipase family protein [Flavobacteriaceae bacterium]
MKPIVNTFLTLLLPVIIYGQEAPIKPGFNVAEYRELLKISTRQGDSLYNNELPAPAFFQRNYRSSVMGLDNRWELWLSKQKTAAISIRGTTLKVESWVENFFAAMIPASGSLKLNDELQYHYSLSEDPRAAVHIGWLIGALTLFEDMQTKIDWCIQNDIKDFYIIGHSQGGAIAYLITSLFNTLKKQNPEIYGKIRVKTYASAAPKPGNLYYAYAYEKLTQMGWAFNVVNSADWVPEGPFSIQTTSDFNSLNPFLYIDEEIKKMSFSKRIVLKYAFNQLNKPTRKANRKFNKYLGKIMSKQIMKYYPEFEPPIFVGSTNYVRVGNTIVLYANSSYFEEFPNKDGELWQHHKFEAYFYLLDRL